MNRRSSNARRAPRELVDTPVKLLPWSREARDEARPDRIGGQCDDWNGACRAQGWLDRRRRDDHDEIDLRSRELRREGRGVIAVAIGPSVVDSSRRAVDVSLIAQGLTDTLLLRGVGPVPAQHSDAGSLRLRPGDPLAAERQHTEPHATRGRAGRAARARSPPERHGPVPACPERSRRRRPVSGATSPCSR